MIDLIDMDDVPGDTADDATGAAQPPAQQAPAQPALDPRRVASEITQSVLSGLSQQFQNQNNTNIVEATVRELIAKGIPPAAVEGMMRMNLAFQHENLKAVQEKEQIREVQNFAKSFWKQAEDIFDRYEAKLSKEYAGIGYAKQGILEAYKSSLEHDPAFKREWEKMEQRGELPASSVASKAMAKVIEDFVSKMGGKKEPSPVALGGAKPQQVSTAGGDLRKLDARQLAMYRTFRKTKGDEFDAKAYERALKS